MKNVLYLLPFLFFGCLSDAKLARKCQEKFPVVIKTVSDTVLIDSIRTLPSDVSMLPMVRTVVCPASAFPSKIEVNCPICSLQVEYRTRYVTKMVLDSANLFLLKDKLLKEIEKREAVEKLNEKLKLDSEKYTILRKTGNKILIGLCLFVVAIFLYLRFIKKKSSAG